MNSHNMGHKQGVPPDRPTFASTRLLDQVRERLRYLHYSLRTEDAYVYWVRFFVRFSGMKHPRSLGRAEVEAFLSMLASQRQVSVSTHRQALSALLFLYKEVLGQELPWMDEIGRPTPTRRIPSVLTLVEVQRVLDLIDGEAGLVVRLLYGTGMRRNEALSLRVKDLDFDRHVIVVRNGKGRTASSCFPARWSSPCAINSPARIDYGRRTAQRNAVASIFHMRLRQSIRAPASPGGGIGCFLRRSWPSIRAQASSGVITCSSNAYSVR
jgi:integrase